MLIRIFQVPLAILIINRHKRKSIINDAEFEIRLFRKNTICKTKHRAFIIKLTTSNCTI
jgi:hypothetical protein